MTKRTSRPASKDVASGTSYPKPARPSTTLLALLCLGLTVLTAGAFLRVLECDFINYDDPSYVTDNPHVQQGLTPATARWALTATEASNWHPLTWVSHGLDHQLFGLRPYGHHLMNLLLHVANVLVLFTLLACMTRHAWPSAIVAAFFGLHPLHVESVAWISERKDVLSTLLLFLTIAAYLNYVRHRSAPRYLLVIVVFGLALMSKPMVVTLPCLLLLLDFWPLRRMAVARIGSRAASPYPLASLVAEKIPLFALAAGASIVTFVVQRQAGSVVSLDTIPIGVRCANALLSYVTYIRKMIWPFDLAIFYPYVPHPSRLGIVSAVVLLSAITLVVFRQASSRPYLLAGWLWYLITLLPAVGIIQAGEQALADRYTYVPLVGLFIIVAWGGCDLFARRYRVVGVIGCILAIGGCVVATSYQVRYWRTSETLFAHALHVTRANDMAHLNLGVELQRQGRTEEAKAHYNQALAIRPDYAAAHNDLGLALESQGLVRDAIEHYRGAIRLAPRYVDAHYNLAHALAEQGLRSAARDEYATALRLSPDDPQAHNNLGLLLSEEGDLDGAIDHFKRALRVNPHSVEAHINLGAAYRMRGDLDHAITEYSIALQMDPTSAFAHNNLANALAQQRRFNDAVVHYAAALQLNPAYAEAHFNWGNMMSEQGKFGDAITHYREALRINPEYEEARRTLARARAAAGEPTSAANE